MGVGPVAAGLALTLLAPSARAAYDDVGERPKTPLHADPVAPGRPGELVSVPGQSRVFGRGAVLRFSVEVEGGLRIDRAAFAARVTAILADRRGWGVAVQRVPTGAVDFRVTLAGAATTDRLCAPVPTNGLFSCAEPDRAVLNATRWLEGAEPYRGELDRYRIYMVNHEVGHVLGEGHTGCFGTGLLAPVMMQQTKGLGGCRPNPWPLDWERG
jgi:Protein of unknown function (DUF3152)